MPSTPQRVSHPESSSGSAAGCAESLAALPSVGSKGHHIEGQSCKPCDMADMAEVFLCLEVDLGILKWCLSEVTGGVGRLICRDVGGPSLVLQSVHPTRP